MRMKRKKRKEKVWTDLTHTYFYFLPPNYASLPALLRSYGVEDALEASPITDQDSTIALVQDLFTCVSAGGLCWKKKLPRSVACVIIKGFNERKRIRVIFLFWVCFVCPNIFGLFFFLFHDDSSKLILDLFFFYFSSNLKAASHPVHESDDVIALRKKLAVYIYVLDSCACALLEEREREKKTIGEGKNMREETKMAECLHFVSVMAPKCFYVCVVCFLGSSFYPFYLFPFFWIWKRLFRHELMSQMKLAWIACANLRPSCRSGVPAVWARCNSWTWCTLPAPWSTPKLAWVALKRATFLTSPCVECMAISKRRC